MIKTKFIAYTMIGFLCTGWGVNSAFGFPVTWEFTGEITGVLDPNDFLKGAVRTGDSFSGLYTFESTTPDSAPDDPIFGVYNDAITAISGQFGDIAFFGTNNLSSVITVRDRDVGVENDQYFIDILNIPVLGGTFDFFLRYVDANGDTFQSDLLPVFPPDLSLGVASVSFRGDNDTVIIGHLTSLVPEPGTLALLTLGALAVIRRRRCKRARIARIVGVFGVVVLLSLAGTSEVRAQWTGGPVLIGGDDIDDHIQGGSYIREGFNFLGGHVTNGKTIAVCIGCNT